jgi:uncharacterized ubiquitin-like protein YukD
VVEAQRHEEKWIKVIVIYGDRSETFNFNINFTITRVVEEAIKRFNLPPPPVNYQVFYEGKLLEPHKSLKDYGIKEGDKLVLVHVHVVG